MCRFASVLVTAQVDRLLTTLLLVLFLSTGASAQSASTSAPPGYDAAVDVAFEEFEAGNYPEARARFLQAYELFPNARVLRALGKTEYELKNYLAALSYMEQALVSTVRPLTAQQRTDTQQLLDRARGYVARYTISTQPAQSTLRVDGVDVQPDASGAVLLTVGEHVIEARATGYQSERRTVEVVGRSDQTLQLELVALAPEPEPPSVLEPAPVVVAATEGEKDTTSTRQPLRRKWWLWTSVGAVVVAGVVTGIVLSQQEPGTELPDGGNTKTRFAVGN